MDFKKISRFRIKDRLGGGGFGEIYFAEDEETSKQVAVKFETGKTHTHLFTEYRIYRLMEGAVGVPKVMYYGTKGDYNALVMELLGKSLQTLFNMCNHKFTLKTILMIADQLLVRIEYLHNKNLIHRDVKPDNFVIGTGKKSNHIYIIDLGITKRYCDRRTHEHIEMVTDKPFVGTAKFASINSHLGNEQSRRDDMESIAYILIYLCKGELPWQHIRIKDKKEKIAKIKEIKLATPVEALCEGLEPEFAIFLNEIRALAFEERPDYSKYREMFRSLFIRKEFVYDGVWDWETKLPVIEKKTSIIKSGSSQIKHPRLINNKSRILTTLNKPTTAISKSRLVRKITKPRTPKSTGLI